MALESFLPSTETERIAPGTQWILKEDCLECVKHYELEFKRIIAHNSSITEDMIGLFFESFRGALQLKSVCFSQSLNTVAHHDAPYCSMKKNAPCYESDNIINSQKLFLANSLLNVHSSYQFAKTVLNLTEEVNQLYPFNDDNSVGKNHSVPTERGVKNTYNNFFLKVCPEVLSNLHSSETNNNEIQEEERHTDSINTETHVSQDEIVVSKATILNWCATTAKYLEEVQELKSCCCLIRARVIHLFRTMKEIMLKAAQSVIKLIRATQLSDSSKNERFQELVALLNVVPKQSHPSLP